MKIKALTHYRGNKYYERELELPAFRHYEGDDAHGDSDIYFYYDTKGRTYTIHRTKICDDIEWEFSFDDGDKGRITMDEFISYTTSKESFLEVISEIEKQCARLKARIEEEHDGD